MEYIKLIFGIGFIVIFTWLLVRNSKRSGFIHALFHIDTILGMAAGFYLIFTSVHSLLIH